MVRRWNPWAARGGLLLCLCAVLFNGLAERVVASAVLGPAVLVPVGAPPGSQGSVEARAAQLLRVVASVAGRPKGEAGPDPVPVRVRNGAVPRAALRSGWFDVDARELIVQAGVGASADDALFAMLQAELRLALGQPASPWFERGLIHGLVGRCGGFSLAEIEGRSGQVTPSEVVGSGEPRSRVAMAPAEARLARSLLVASGQDVRSAWQLSVTADSGLMPALEAAWEKSFERTPVEPRLAYPRSVREGSYVALDLPASITPELKGDFARLQRLGFAGIHLGVTVPIELDRVPLDRITNEGDGVMIAVALQARAAGLSVVLAPRFHGPRPEPLVRSIEAQAAARGRVVEGLSWLAEEGLVDGMILFQSDELLQPESPGISQEVRAARREFRRRVLVASRPFAGDRFAFADDAATLASARTERLGEGFQGALAVIRLKLGEGAQIDTPFMRLVGPWDPGPEGELGEGLRALSDESLKALVGKQ